MTFQEKVKSMTGAEIIMAMVKGLEKPVVNVNMEYFGAVREEKTFFGFFKKKVCYGCAATNTICTISGVNLNQKNIFSLSRRANAVKSDVDFLRGFERAINCLRLGSVQSYNSIARSIDIATLSETVELPHLDTNYTQQELDVYKELAATQDFSII